MLYWESVYCKMKRNKIFGNEYNVLYIFEKSKGKGMKSEKKILVAFLLNLLFSVFELVGGLFIGSVAILSDALHDFGDAASIGISWRLERKSMKAPDARHTYGYGRYSVLGGLLTTVILLCGSVMVVISAIHRLWNPTTIYYDGMILFALVGVVVNFLAAWFTREGDSINQKAVNLHMLEDVLGWAVVLVGAIIMRFTDFWYLDPILSIAVAVFIFISALGQLKQIGQLFLMQTPTEISTEELMHHLLQIEGVEDIHHLHIWSLDGRNHSATMHVVAVGDHHAIKEAIRDELSEHGIGHATLELEKRGEPCPDPCHKIDTPHQACHHHHHH